MTGTIYPTTSNAFIQKRKDFLHAFYCIFGIYLKFGAFSKKKKKKNESLSLITSELMTLNDLVI